MWGLTCPAPADRLLAVEERRTSGPGGRVDAACPRSVPFRHGRPDRGARPGHRVAGSSEASPLFAGVVALADQVARHRLGFLNQRLYEMGADLAAGIVDVTTGSNPITFCSANCGTPQEQDITIPGFTATTGFDLASGWGTIDAARFVPELARSGGDD